MNPIEWAKLVYGATGAHYPLISSFVVAVLFAGTGVVLWTIVGQQYQKDQEKQLPAAVAAVQPQPSNEQADASTKPTPHPTLTAAPKTEPQAQIATKAHPQEKQAVTQDRSVHIESGSSVRDSPIITGDNANVIVSKLPPPQMTREGQNRLIGLLESADEQQLWVDIPYGGPTQEYASQIAGALAQVPKWKVILVQITSWPREANMVTIGTSKESTATSNAKLLHDALTAAGVENKWVRNMDGVNDPRYIIIFVPPPQ